MIFRKQSALKGEPYEVWNIADTRPVHQLHPMMFNGLGTDFQYLRNLLGVPAFGNELEDFTLTSGQAWPRVAPGNVTG